MYSLHYEITIEHIISTIERNNWLWQNDESFSRQYPFDRPQAKGDKIFFRQFLVSIDFNEKFFSKFIQINHKAGSNYKKNRLIDLIIGHTPNILQRGSAKKLRSSNRNLLLTNFLRWKTILNSKNEIIIIIHQEFRITLTHSLDRWRILRFLFSKGILTYGLLIFTSKCIQQIIAICQNFL